MQQDASSQVAIGVSAYLIAWVKLLIKLDQSTSMASCVQDHAAGDVQPAGACQRGMPVRMCNFAGSADVEFDPCSAQSPLLMLLCCPLSP